MRCSKLVSERVGLGFSAGSRDRGVGLRIERGGVSQFESSPKCRYRIQLHCTGSRARARLVGTVTGEAQHPSLFVLCFWLANI